MRAIRYNLHFLILALAAIVFWLARDLDLPASIVDLRVVHYGLMGLLHALALVASLRDRKAARPITTLCFIALAAARSIAIPIVALWTSVFSLVWYPFAWLARRGDHSYLLLWLHGSALGAVGYWFLVRGFWMKSLRRTDLLRTLTLCVPATFLVVISGDAVDTLTLKRPDLWTDGSGVMLTVAWWFAFSLSLYWSEISKEASSSRKIAFAIAGAVSALGLVMWFFELASAPLDRQARADQARLSDLKSIAGTLHVEWEYAQDKNLEWKAPDALKDIATDSHGARIRITDPTTGAPYDYMPVSGSDYQLCAVFDSDGSAQDFDFTDNGWTFPKGRHCFAVDASKSPY